MPQEEKGQRRFKKSCDWLRLVKKLSSYRDRCAEKRCNTLILKHFFCLVTATKTGGERVNPSVIPQNLGQKLIGRGARRQVVRRKNKVVMSLVDDILSLPGKHLQDICPNMGSQQIMMAMRHLYRTQKRQLPAV